MTRLRLFRNLRTLAYLLVLVSVLAGIGFVVWANQTGLPATWRGTIERELAKHGVHASIGSLSLHPLKGIVARDVVLFSDPEHTQEFGRLERLLLDVDKTRIARGTLSLTKVVLEDATLDVRIAPEGAPAEILPIRDLNGTLLMPGGRLVELRDAHATVAGFHVTLGARLLKYRPTGQIQTPDTGKQGRLLAISQLLRELRNWRFDQTSPPALRCFVEGDLADWSSLVVRMNLSAAGVEKNGHVIDSVEAGGSYGGSLLSLTHVRASDDRGSFEGRVDYDMGNREGRFSLTSSVNLPNLLHSWVGWHMTDSASFGGSQMVESEGVFHLRPDGPPQMRLTGRAHCTAVRLKGVLFDSAEASFAWRDDQIYLRDIRLQRPDGVATGKVMIQWPLVRMALRTTLPIAVYRPFFVRQPLEPVLNDFSELPGARVEVSLDGGFDATDRHSWAYSGHGRVENVAFRGVPVDAAETELSLSHHALDFSNGTATFRFRDYPLRKANGGPASGTLRVERVRFDAAEKTVTVNRVRGAAWAAPVVRTFAPAVADSLEIYRFRRPPELAASGVVDVTPQGRTDLTVSFESDAPADYVFLGKSLVLGSPSGSVRIKGPVVDIDNLALTACGGEVKASISVAPQNRVTCETSWTDVSMNDLNSTYGLNMNGGGYATGRANLNLTAGRIETLNGTGLLSVERSVLFSAPVLGPLSTVVSAVLGDKRAGFERAKSAFCTFRIQDGVLHSRDFTTSTTSLVFAADGSVDLVNKSIDVNVRVNARGLLGLVTLPLRPFSGLFQFRGTGPLSKPEWVNAPVTAPLPEQEEALQGTPRAIPVERTPRAIEPAAGR